MSLPELTHLQFLLLDILMGTEKSGKELRAELAQRGIRKSGPAFYQMMSRLESAKLVRGHYAQIEIEQQTVRERRYEITAKGLAARDAVRTFYESAGIAVRGITNPKLT